jgi:hypothetical protein
MSKTAMTLALEALRNAVFDEHTADETLEAIKALEEALAKQEQGEPDKYVMDIECTKCGAKQSGILTVNTTPQPAQKPLTVNEICNMVARISDVRNPYIQFARAIEAAHGIKENT